VKLDFPLSFSLSLSLSLSLSFFAVSQIQLA
jgi:hypothetical protein